MEYWESDSHLHVVFELLHANQAQKDIISTCAAVDLVPFPVPGHWQSMRLKKEEKMVCSDVP